MMKRAMVMKTGTMTYITFYDLFHFMHLFLYLSHCSLIQLEEHYAVVCEVV